MKEANAALAAAIAVEISTFERKKVIYLSEFVRSQLTV